VEAIAERNNGWIDDAIPLSRVHIDCALPAADRTALLASLSRMTGMQEITIARNSPDASWIRANIDPSKLERVSIDGRSSGSGISEIRQLIAACPRLFEIQIYGSSLSTDDTTSLQQECSSKKIILEFDGRADGDLRALQ